MCAWNWLNAFTVIVIVIVMLMGGRMIFNAHPQLYWGQYGANHEVPWLEIGSADGGGFLRLAPSVYFRNRQCTKKHYPWDAV